MKTVVTLLLAASLLLNAVIVSLYVGGRSQDAAAPADTATAKARTATTSSASSIDAGTWKSLESEELPDIVARLRASGFPPSVLRAIVAAQLRESFAARRKALTADYERGPWWQNPIRDPKTQLAIRALDREEQKRLRELLGADAESTDPMMRFNRERGLEFLPADKADEVRAILRDHEERRADLFMTGFSYLTDQPKMEALDKELQATLARTLTADELLEYNMRRSRSADRLRDELTAFNPTEEEFRALLKVRLPFDEQHGDYRPGMSQEEMRRRSEAEQQLKQQMKAVLQPARVADYDRMTDYNYRRTSQLVARLQLPPDTTDRLHAVQKDVEQRRNELYRSVRSAADREQITGQLRALQEEAVAKVTPILGNARAVGAYRQHGGTWISSLVPRPATPPPPAKK